VVGPPTRREPAHRRRAVRLGPARPHADIPDIEAIWLDGADEHSNPMGSRGAGEIGIVGSAAAVVNAVYHATGVRVRDLPVTCDKVLSYQRD
jgi:CO/xanthine dehydrogenase Mo-binding subunit